MTWETIAFHPVLGYVVMSGAAGLILLVVFLIEEHGSVHDPWEPALLLLLPAIGWGWWKAGQQQRRGVAHAPSRIVVVLRRLALYDLLILTFQFLLLLVLVYDLGHRAMVDIGPDPSMTNATGAVLEVGTEIAANVFIGMGTMLIIGSGFVAYILFLLLFSGLPWFIAQRLRSGELRSRLQ